MKFIFKLSLLLFIGMMFSTGYASTSTLDTKDKAVEESPPWVIQKQFVEIVSVAILPDVYDTGQVATNIHIQKQKAKKAAAGTKARNTITRGKRPRDGLSWA